MLQKSLLDKREQVIKKLDSYGINFLIGKRTVWKDCSQFDLIKTVPETINAFKDCFFHHCKRIYDGILYVCPHQLAGIQLNKLQALTNETIHIHDYTTEQLSSKLEQIQKLQTIDACRYCTMPNSKDVPAGEQLP